MKILLLVILVWGTYFRSIFNKYISDDISKNGDLKLKKYPVRIRDLLECPNKLLDDLVWKLCKDNSVAQHLISITIFSAIVPLLYITLCKLFPENVAYLTAILFAVHPCNAQICGWISGRPYALAFTIGILAVYFNSVLLYVFSAVPSVNMFPLILFLKTSIPMKVLGLCIFLWFISVALKQKETMARAEDAYKRENFRIYPRKIIIAFKSCAYYFGLALLPVKMGWFHEIGEPITQDLKKANFHFALSVLLFITLFLYLGTPQFIGLLIFMVFIAQFSNIITLGLFTAERYMTPALVGVCIFLAYTLVNYPILATILITYYFVRTQLELWAYRDDFTLALYSLLSFPNSGFAWCNVAHIFMCTNKPHAAFDLLNETKARIPEFPSTYYILHQIYRCTDLMNNMTLALENLEKACMYGQHSSWFDELEKFKKELKKQRVERFWKNVTRSSTTRNIQPPIKFSPETDRKECVGVIA